MTNNLSLDFANERMDACVFDVERLFLEENEVTVVANGIVYSYGKEEVTT